MKNWWKIAVAAVVLLAVIGIVQLKTRSAAAPSAPPLPPAPEVAAVLDPEPGALTSEVAPVYGPEPAPPASSGVSPAAKPKQTQGPQPAKTPDPPSAPTVSQPDKPVPAPKPAPAEKQLPRLLELGSLSCVPCKMMVPVLDALKQEYAGELKVEFVDVYADPAAANSYGIQSIPTQILFDSSGKEVFRHLGFWPKEEIVAQCKELGLLD